MQRIDGPFNVSTKPALSPAANSPGFFSGGDPARGRKATRVTKDWLNWVQEEICHVIEAAGITLDRVDDTQLLQALQALFGISPGGGGGGAYKPLEPGDFEFFYRQSPPAGWAAATGGVLVGADVAVPKLWAELQKAEKAWLLKNQVEWSALSQAAPWNGIGGVPFFVMDINARTIRLPDLRGMYAEAAGFDGLAVGGVHGDAIRNITASIDASGQQYYEQAFGEIYPSKTLVTGAFGTVLGAGYPVYDVTNTGTFTVVRGINFDASRVVPTANVNRPRAFGALACVYVGGTE